MTNKVWIVMGQAACANLKKDDVAICTGTLYSCSGITMYNNTTGRGGLYHFPSGVLSDETSQDYKSAYLTLTNMIADVKPDSVEVVTASDPLAGMMLSLGGTPESDKEAITSFISKCGKAAAFGNEGAWAGISPKGITCSSPSDEDWPAGSSGSDLQSKGPGMETLPSGVKVVLFGKSGESGKVDPTFL